MSTALAEDPEAVKDLPVQIQCDGRYLWPPQVSVYPIIHLPPYTSFKIKPTLKKLNVLWTFVFYAAFENKVKYGLPVRWILFKE